MQRLLLLIALMVLANGVTSSARRTHHSLGDGDWPKPEYEQRAPKSCKSVVSKVRSQIDGKYPAKIHSVEPIECICKMWPMMLSCRIRAFVVEQPKGERCHVSTRYVFLETSSPAVEPAELVDFKLDFGLDEPLKRT